MATAPWPAWARWISLLKTPLVALIFVVSVGGQVGSRAALPLARRHRQASAHTSAGRSPCRPRHGSTGTPPRFSLRPHTAKRQIAAKVGLAIHQRGALADTVHIATTGELRAWWRLELRAPLPRLTKRGWLGLSGPVPPSVRPRSRMKNFVISLVVSCSAIFSLGVGATAIASPTPELQITKIQTETDGPSCRQ